MKMNNFTYEEVCFLEVPILREELRNIDLSSQGLKAELIERVWSHYEEQRILQDKPERSSYPKPSPQFFINQGNNRSKWINLEYTMY